MGTSTGYLPPKGPQWNKVKSEAGNAIKNPFDSNFRKALAAHIVARSSLGGSGSSGTNSSSGGHSYGGRSTRFNVAQKLGNFISNVRTLGLEQALSDIGLSDFIGKSLNDILNGIIQVFSEGDGVFEEIDALTAIGAVLDDICRDCSNSEEFETKLKMLADAGALSEIFEKFFRYALVEDFIRRNWAKLQDKYSNDEIAKLKDNVAEFLIEKVKYEYGFESLATLNWKAPETVQLLQQIEEETLSLCIVEGDLFK